MAWVVGWWGYAEGNPTLVGIVRGDHRDRGDRLRRAPAVEAMMAELARGNISDRPWGRTLGALAMRGLTGQLNLYTDGKAFSVAFNQGVVAGAASPLANDAAVRVAMTGRLVSSTQVNDISRRLAAATGRDEIDRDRRGRCGWRPIRRIACAGACSPSVRRGRSRSSAASSSSRIGSRCPVMPGSELDIRSVVYLGARNNLSEQRLEVELDQMGNWFQLKPDAERRSAVLRVLRRRARRCVDRLRNGASLIELHAAAPEIDGRSQRAIVYALVACGACSATTAPPPPSAVDLDPPTVTRTRTVQVEDAARSRAAGDALVERACPDRERDQQPGRRADVERRWHPEAGHAGTEREQRPGGRAHVEREQHPATGDALAE